MPGIMRVEVDERMLRANVAAEKDEWSSVIGLDIRMKDVLLVSNIEIEPILNLKNDMISKCGADVRP